jgi:hypothetical protein
VFGLLYGIFAALTWIMHRRSRHQPPENHAASESGTA